MVNKTHSIHLRTRAEGRQKPNGKPLDPPVKSAKVVAVKQTKPPKESEPVERKPCLCGCGEKPAGKKARFLPGHDARYHAKLKPPKVMPECGCGCRVQTKGGRFLPGHDARYHAALAAKERGEKPKKVKTPKPELVKAAKSANPKGAAKKQMAAIAERRAARRPKAPSPMEAPASSTEAPVLEVAAPPEVATA